MSRIRRMLRIGMAAAVAGWQISAATWAQEMQRPDVIALTAANATMESGVVSPDMRVGYDGRYRISTAYTSSDGKFVAGLWSSGPGGIKTDGFWRDEYFRVVAGELEVTSRGGQPHEFQAGDAFVIPKGWAGVWTMKTNVTLEYAFYGDAAK